MVVKHYGWMGKILRIDLTASNIDIDDTERYCKEYVGGRGIASRIAWETLKLNVTAFSPENVLIFMTGPLTGTSAPYSGRTTIETLAPQGFPVEWFTRSSFGGHWGPELKYAGWDGIVITGKADKPVYILINNDSVSIEDAAALWGKGIFETQKKLISRYGKKTRVFAIGPAGENLSRIAIAATETESAAGQGGFGAVMGAKNLKAIAVLGNQPINIAQPEKFYQLCELIKQEAHGSHGWPHPIKLDDKMVKKYGQRFQACTQQCHTGCFDARYYTHVPGVICRRILSGQVDCVAGLFPGLKDSFYNWKLGFEAGFEIGQMTNDFGLNHWELLIGMVPWLRDAAKHGIITKIDGVSVDFDNVYFWEKLLNDITFQKGEIGKALSEGTIRAAHKLGRGEELLLKYFSSWGYAGHWDGHGDHINHIVYPFWIVAALQWAMDTRDPISSGHGYTQNIMNWSKINSPKYGISWEAIMKIGKKIYGSTEAVDPQSGYSGKAYPAFWHNHRSVHKDSLPIDDQMFPRIYSKYTEDNFSKIAGIDGIDFEYNLLITSTGLDFTPKDFDFYAEKVINLERLLLIRQHNRSRADDETLIPYFEQPENCINPIIGEPMSLDGQKFRTLMDEFYDLRGWNKENGHPKEETLKRLNLQEEGKNLI